MKTVPDSLLEAAEIDGCSKRKALTKIMIPLSVPALITSSLVNLVWVWNELLISLVFLQKEELRTLMVGITLFKGRFIKYTCYYGRVGYCDSADRVDIYICAEIYLVEGMLAGSVKE